MGWADVLYPLALMSGVCGIFLLVSIGFSYLGLVLMNRRATKCPECGKGGSGELIESEMINSVVRTEMRTHLGLFRQEKRQVQVTEETYEDHFKCQHCGHQWTKNAKWTKTSPDEERLLH
jgi:predicted RNA-binding Zn-ribbon protein involved in translation (DUF1610 family)